MDLIVLHLVVLNSVFPLPRLVALLRLKSPVSPSIYLELEREELDLYHFQSEMQIISLPSKFLMITTILYVLPYKI